MNIEIAQGMIPTVGNVFMSVQLTMSIPGMDSAIE